MLRRSLLLLLTALAGCTSLSTLLPHDREVPRASGAAVDRETTSALLLVSTIQTLQRLQQGSPAEQAEILSSARQAAEHAPDGSAQLRYALVLATPGHSGRDLAHAGQLLRELAAQPERLVPAERALTLVELAQVEQELQLAAANDRLEADLQRTDRDRQGAQARRLQSELEENTRLRQKLEETQSKLDAIATIERNIERKTSNQGHQP